MDRTISRLLRGGLLLSASLVLLGAVIYLARHGGETVSYRAFHGEPPVYRELASIFGEAARFRGRGFILAGLILLVATPVARVAFSVFAFLRRRDRFYAAVTTFVLAVLLFSVFWLGLR